MIELLTVKNDAERILGVNEKEKNHNRQQVFLFMRVIADAEDGLKIRAHQRPDLQGFGDG